MSIAPMDEREKALLIAERWLNFDINPLVQMVPGDPDCDACVLARQVIRLNERLGPRGLEVVMIDGSGHYVNETVKAEIEKLRSKIKTVVDTFERDEAQGYHSNDRQFALQILKERT